MGSNCDWKKLIDCSQEDRALRMDLASVLGCSLIPCPLFPQEDCDLENVWLMGGLSVLTSVPGGPPMVCLLCASKGLHEVGYLHFFTAPQVFTGPYCLISWALSAESYSLASWSHAVPIIHSSHPQLVFCQVCCDPFHPFCLEEAERPLPQHHDTWCCRRCKFCHVCGRKGRGSKVWARAMGLVAAWKRRVFLFQ